MVLNDNGSWCWFEGERAVVDAASGRILVSSVANAAGPGGATRAGDVEVTSLELATGAVSRFTLNADRSDNAGWGDDHNSAALWVRPDGRYLAMYSRHSGDALSRYRISAHPGDASSWSAEQTFDNRAGTTYSNLHYLRADQNGAGRLYDFTRTANFNPNLLVSADLGTTWSYGGRLLTQGTGRQRPYVRYASNGERIDFIATEQHPRNFDNSVYHGYIQGGRLYDSAGRPVDGNLLDAEAVAPTALTALFRTGAEFGGVAMRRAWTIDIAIDDRGRPYALFQARAGDDDGDHRFFYARFDGERWAVHQLAKAGGFLYRQENDYTGLAALDPRNPDRLFISTTIDPRSDAPLPHYEIFQGDTSDGGATWNWSPITYRSSADNLRPLVPKGGGEHTALLWLRGRYSAYTNYDLRVVGLTAIRPLAEPTLAAENAGAAGPGDGSPSHVGGSGGVADPANAAD
ncbi:MAG: BNR-4 repeat-containing protein [Pirellulales bacterium]|nr:BNR-4 repeat-containing protein [Pirellulales bacterium]